MSSEEQNLTNSRSQSPNGLIRSQKRINVYAFVEGDMAKGLPVLCYCVVRDEDELRGYVFVYAPG
jgi:hypothetical protein